MMRIIAFFLFAIISMSTYAQDIHFSQFGRSYLALNPALTGSFNANYRLNANYKNQWSSISEPYRTFAFAADANSLIPTAKNLHFGVLLFNDEAGVGGLTTTQAMLSIAANTSFGYNSVFVLKGGIQAGILSRSIDFDKFSFDQQFDGIQYIPNNLSGEDFERDAYINPMANAGIALQYEIERGRMIEGGFGIFNILKTNQSFQGSNVPLDMRYTSFIRADLNLTNAIDLLPALLYSTQAKYQELVLGSNIRYRFNGNNYRNENLYLGLWYRNKDAVIASIGFDYNDFNVGLSYDINTSGLNSASRHRGGLEISLTYLIRIYRAPNIKRYIECPDFL